MRQLIIIRKDLNMSPGKIAAQASHASMAFIKRALERADFLDCLPEDDFLMRVHIRPDVWCDWFCGIYTKIICEAKNKNKLLKAAEKAKSLGLEENEDFFLIKDHCLTELEPEEIGEDGIGKVLTCIGFRPLDDDTAKAISTGYQLLH